MLAELDRQGEAENTLVLFLSDNGRPFPRCKTTVYDSGIETPWIVRWPARVAAGTRCEGLVSSIDIAPTFLALAGLTPGPTFQGKDFSPLLRDPKATIRRYVFAEHNWHDYAARGRAVRSERFKYIRNDDADLPNTPPADAVRSPTFQAMRRLRDAGKLATEQMSCFTRPRPAEELYDTEADPHELHNLAADPRFAETLATLRSERWRLAAGHRRRDARRPQPRRVRPRDRRPPPEPGRPRPAKTRAAADPGASPPAASAATGY